MISSKVLPNTFHSEKDKARNNSSVDWNKYLRLPLKESIPLEFDPVGYENAVCGLLTKMYDFEHPPDERRSKLRRRFLKSPALENLEVFLSGMQRQHYEAYNHQYQNMNQTWNRLAFSKDSLVYRNQVALAPDGIPFFPYHFLLRPVDPTKLDEQFIESGLVDFRFGLVTSEHLDVRRHFTYEDVINMAKLVKTFPSYMVSQSMEGSGASIEENIHAHAFPAKETKFPLFNPSCASEIYRCSNLWFIDEITFGIIVSGTPEDIAHVFNDLRNEFQLPSNHYIQARNDFDGLTGLFVPRTQRIPNVLRLAEADWKFGAFEVLGLFDAKNEEIYNTLTSDEGEEAIRSVTVQDFKLRNDFKAKARATILNRHR